MTNDFFAEFTAKLEADRAQNVANMARGLQVFDERGLDTATTMGDAINYIRDLNQGRLAQLPGDGGYFHDGIHAVLLAPDGKTENEIKVGIGEGVLLRSTFHHSAFIPTDDHYASKPISPLSEQFAFMIGKDRKDTINKHKGTNTNLPYEDMRATFEQAKTIQSFIDAATNGRRYDELSLDQLMNTPLVYFGITARREAETMIFVDIPDRDTLEQALREAHNPALRFDPSAAKYDFKD